MVFNVFKLIFFFGFIFIESKITLSQNVSQKYKYGPYDVVQSVEELVKNVRTSEILRNIKSSQSEHDVLNSMHGKDTFNFLDLNNFKNMSNNKCLQDILYIIKNVQNIDLNNLGGDQWAIKMIDSFGKPESGILDGNLKWLGDFKECRNVYAPKDESGGTDGFHGKYCLSQVSLSFLSITLGICVPDSCGPLDFMLADTEFLFEIFSKLSPALRNFVPKLQSITCKANSRDLSSAAIATICLVSFFTLLALIGSCITVARYFLTLLTNKQSEDENRLHQYVNSVNQGPENYNDAESTNMNFENGESATKKNFLQHIESFFNCFCVFTNGSKLLNTDSTEGQLLCLHGIRFLSMSWVILCHLYMGSVNMIRSMLDVLPQVDNIPFQVVLNGFYSVDSFFLLSGFLMAYLYFKEADKRKGNMSWKSWIYFYVHRYLRLTPVYMIVLATYATLMVYFGSGPFWPDYDVEPNCHKNWWWNVLYINNFKKSAEQCMGWAWYLANDMQFFAISPLFLITLWKWPLIGYGILALFFCGGWISSFVITYCYNLVPGGIGDVPSIAKDPAFMVKFNDYFDKIYTKPYGRIGPYLVGISLAYIFFKRKQSNGKIHFVITIVGWVTATVFGLTCVYGLYRNSPSVVVSSFYNSLSRTCFAACLGWVIFACLSGIGGPVDKILSCKLFLPLSRLTYCAYLIHPIIFSGYFASLKHTLSFSHPTMVSLFLGLMTVTYAVAFVISLVFESPLIRLEKLILKRN